MNISHSSGERSFLDAYDPGQFERPSVAVDLVLLSVSHGAPNVLLLRRQQHPFKGSWTLPGTFVGIDEGLDEAVARLLVEKVRLNEIYSEQLYTFGDVQRDPRTRVISVAYLALLPPSVAGTLDPAANLLPAEVHLPPDARDCDVPRIVARGDFLQLGFDHAQIAALAVRRLRGKLDYSDVAFALLPERFTLRELQDVHEGILGTKLNKSAFRRRILDKGQLEPTGTRETGASFRPAELYRLKSMN